MTGGARGRGDHGVVHRRRLEAGVVLVASVALDGSGRDVVGDRAHALGLGAVMTGVAGAGAGVYSGRGVVEFCGGLPGITGMATIAIGCGHDVCGILAQTLAANRGDMTAVVACSASDATHNAVIHTGRAPDHN
jgi:hypothetical protein